MPLGWIVFQENKVKKTAGMVEHSGGENEGNAK